jgi:hypothetical protein
MKLPLQTLIDVWNKLNLCKKTLRVFQGMTSVMELPLQTLIDVWKKLNVILCKKA